MGTDAHRPPPAKELHRFDPAPAPEAEARPPLPGERPGVRSRLRAALEKRRRP